MIEDKPTSGYNLPPGCFEHDIDSYFGEGRPMCFGCKHMVECCCDYGVCDLEYKEAFNAEFGNWEIAVEATDSEIAEWALDWISNHMRDMQGVACEYFAK